MKRRFISELIAADLNELAYSGSDYIASEESIRFLVDFYNGRGLLTNAIVIHKDQLLAYLHEKISNDPGFLKTEAHYQFFIEVGARSKAQQRTPAAIHYCALDLFISPDSPPFAFVADHYQKFSGYYAEFAQISEKLGIQFLVVGSKDYFQADSVHCPIFTLRHLLLTAHDGHIHNFLKSLVNLQTFPSVVQFDWNSMPPNYVLNSQSFTMLTKYTQSVKDQEGGSLDTPASLLVQHHFDEQISSTLFNDARVNKVRNKSIRYLAAEYAGEAVVALEAQEGYQLESKLIDLCYQTYPLLHSVLRKAFEIQV
ncbi:hypothetical protein EAS68_06720 [Legionella jordanis]|nr:hypothetical protein [Legionella jordanis]RMX19124.1 hypothetical protein EAS68_06720 [Legionella jordanis]